MYIYILFLTERITDQIITKHKAAQDPCADFRFAAKSMDRSLKNEDFSSIWACRWRREVHFRLIFIRFCRLRCNFEFCFLNNGVPEVP